MSSNAIQQVPAEQRYQKELDRLKAWDTHPRPENWKLSPIAVQHFIVGDKELGICTKFIAQAEAVSRIIISLATNRGTMLVGPPGTAKSLLSELLCTAISGDSSLTIQGGAVESISQLLYGWDTTILQQQGHCIEALRPSPLLLGMQQGKLVRFEEIARSAPALQDALLSLLSEKVLLIPELKPPHNMQFAKKGFNVIGTSNSLDDGVEQMSRALKRRMNFESIEPIDDLDKEISLVTVRAKELMRDSGVPLNPEPALLAVLVTIFYELRNGRTVSGRSTDRLASTVLSTAEAISVAHAMGVHAYYFNNTIMSPKDLMHFLIGAALKDDDSDRRRIKHYFETEVAHRNEPMWQAVYGYVDML